MKRNPTPSDIEALINRIDSDSPWTVEDWNHESGRFKQPRVTLDVEWSPLQALDPEDRRDGELAVKEAIDSLEKEEGAHRDDVITEVVDNVDEFDSDTVEAILETLKQKGEIYEPRTAHLRTT